MNKCLDTLRKNDVEFVNIQAEKLVSGNEKITLGIVWTILHHFQVFISIAVLEDFLVSRMQIRGLDLVQVLVLG